MGLLLGDAVTAVRDTATPLAPNKEVARWSTDQGRILQKAGISERAQMETAAVIHALGGNTSVLPICLTSEGWLNREQFCRWASRLDRVVILSTYSWLYLSHFTPVVLEPDVVVTVTHIPANFQYEGDEILHEQTQSETDEFGLSPNTIAALPDLIKEHWDFAKETLESILMTALTKSWRVPLELILANISPEKKNIRIGKSKKLGEMTELATIVQRPSRIRRKILRKSPSQRAL